MEAKNEVVLRKGWIWNAFEFREPEFYNLVTMVIRDDDSKNVYTVTVVQCNQHTSVEQSKYEEKCTSVLFVPGEYISKKETSKIS